MSVVTKKQLETVNCEGCGRDTNSPSRLCYRCTFVGHLQSEETGRKQEVIKDGLEVFDIALDDLMQPRSSLKYHGDIIKADL